MDMADQNVEPDENELEEARSRGPGPPKVQRLNSDANVLIVEHDLGLRSEIWEYPIDEQDQAHRIYINHGPFQFRNDKYPYSGAEAHPHCFQSHWFKDFPWLEYSHAKMQHFAFVAIYLPGNQLEGPRIRCFIVRACSISLDHSGRNGS